MKTIVYIDGYNLYYGLLRRSAYKWLDVYTLFSEQILQPATSQLVEVRYYTAPILSKMCDDPASPARQRSYLQALTKFRMNQVQIIQGKLIASQPKKRPVVPLDGYEIIQVHDFEEKKTDVNIATDMLCDVWSGRCEQVVLCSNDSDQEPALKAIKAFHPHIQIGLVSPVQKDGRYVSADLLACSDWQKRITPYHLQHAQLPDKIPHTSIVKPEAWQP